MATEHAVPAPGGISCRELVELVTDYLEGALSEPLRARFEMHLAACLGCAAYLDQMRATLATLGDLAEDGVLSDVRDRLLEAFRTWSRRA